MRKVSLLSVLYFTLIIICLCIVYYLHPFDSSSSNPQDYVREITTKYVMIEDSSDEKVFIMPNSDFYLELAHCVTDLKNTLPTTSATPEDLDSGYTIQFINLNHHIMEEFQVSDTSIHYDDAFYPTPTTFYPLVHGIFNTFSVQEVRITSSTSSFDLSITNKPENHLTLQQLYSGFYNELLNLEPLDARVPLTPSEQSPVYLIKFTFKDKTEEFIVTEDYVHTKDATYEYNFYDYIDAIYANEHIVQFL